MAQPRSQRQGTSPESIKLLAYGRARSRKAPQTHRLLDWYRQMYLIRRFEEAAAEMYALGKIGGFLHLYIGEEAVAVGAMAILWLKRAFMPFSCASRQAPRSSAR